MGLAKAIEFLGCNSRRRSYSPQGTHCGSPISSSSLADGSSTSSGGSAPSRRILGRLLRVEVRAGAGMSRDSGSDVPAGVSHLGAAGEAGDILHSDP